jgi:hypothetical protein
VYSTVAYEERFWTVVVVAQLECICADAGQCTPAWMIVIAALAFIQPQHPPPETTLCYLYTNQRPKGPTENALELIHNYDYE